MSDRGRRLEELTRRWRQRHDARRDSSRGDRPPADAAREARALAAFPFRGQSPDEYARSHGADMIGFIYDEYAYADPELDAWLVELGAILRRRRGGEEGHRDG